MTQAIPAFAFETRGVSSVNFFSSRLTDILELHDLVSCFRAASSLHGTLSHACFALDTTGRRFLFGDRDIETHHVREAGETRHVREAGLTMATHPVLGWDEQIYEIDMIVSREADAGQIATLKAMGSLYLSHGLALLDARDQSATQGLTANEKFCRDRYDAGLCLLDIAEELDCSVHAVSIYLARARRKQS